MKCFRLSMKTLDELSILSSESVSSALLQELVDCVKVGGIVVFSEDNQIIMVCRTEEELTEFITSKKLL